MSKLKVLFSGASGLLGTYALAKFHSEYEVHAMVRETPKERLEGVHYHICDLKSDWSTDILPTGIHAVFHLAQSDLFREFPDYALDVYHVNVTSTVKLLDYARNTGVKKFIFTSTGGLYENSHVAVNENSPINTLGALGNYFATKYCSEILTHNYKKYFDISILRIFFMYGAGQQRSMLLPRLVDNVLLGRATSLAGEQGIKINPIHVSDVVKLLGKLVTFSGNYVFNVAGPEILTIRQIVEIIAKKTHKIPIFEYSDGAVQDCIANIELLKSILFVPTVKFEQRVEELFVNDTK